ncbi:hypothetical protein NQ315_001422 [Exocentrus adspersus]|uniref:Fibronectin type III domain protein n=1 Tax=Exocentrus adspersus TaxID=1586481 RepID=A0AAV8WG77_9CUCU|nr:hypothetical protein NQ315_001422 [Exocentrus adspersus]
MIRYSALPVFVTIFCVAAIGLTQACVPKSVIEIHLNPDLFLNWTVSEEEECSIAHFAVNLRRNGEEEHDFEVTTTYVDVSSIVRHCEYWQFRVRAVSDDGTVGNSHLLIAQNPLRDESRLALEYLRINSTEAHPRLYWTLRDEEYRKCASTYHVTVEDEETGEFSDFYITDTSALLDFVSPCASYEFEVRAVYRVLNPPRLYDVSVGPTSVNTTWILDSLSTNRCPIRTLYVDGGQHFNISFPVSDDNHREPVAVNLKSLRPNSLYLMRVSVENSAGMSNRSTVGVQTLELSPSKL